MAVSATMYGQLMKVMANKEVDLDSDDIRVMLCTSTYAPNKDTHVYKSSVTNEVTGTGYTAGGQALANRTVSYNAANDTFVFDADDSVWPSSTITARYAVIYDNTGASDAVRALIGYVDFGQDVSSLGASFTIQWDSTGILGFQAL